MKDPAEMATDMAPDDLQKGVITWTTIDAPWLATVDTSQWIKSLDRVRGLEPSGILSSHLPPAFGLTETLLKHLASAYTATPFTGLDQAALESLMKIKGDA
jgi:hypothetical protein